MLKASLFVLLQTCATLTCHPHFHDIYGRLMEVHLTGASIVSDLEAEVLGSLQAAEVERTHNVEWLSRGGWSSRFS